MNPPFLPPGVDTFRARGRKATARVFDAWYVACLSDELKGDRPLPRTILGVPLAVFRGAGGVGAAVLDRCPHRNVPLSMGRCQDGQLQCRYHGWRFDEGGRCRAVPGLPIVDDARTDMPGRNVLAFPVREQDGYVFVWMDPRKQPHTEPFALVQARSQDYLTVRYAMDVEATLHSTLENILDVPHTSFLHGGLFRTEKKRNEITAVVRRGRDGVEAEFIGEPRPEGIAARILSPSGGDTPVIHFDRFFLPSVAQVEYRLGDNHILTTTLCTPIAATTTRMYSVLSIKTRLPVRLVAPVIAPLAWRILAQDKWMLGAQTDVVDRFGTESFSSTPIDLLGPYILHLLKKAEAGALDDAVVREERTKLQV
jgi:phenylpropionate dioxygenase-like ring-hydroxylating dioxygenase large terminal subunit